MRARKDGGGEHWIGYERDDGLETRRSQVKRHILLSGFALVLAGNLFGQTNGPSRKLDEKVVLTGTVYDINHAVIPFARVVARSFEGKEYETKTNDEGRYKIELPSALYRIEANAYGFC
ncbi:MAG: carboxypeptidase-like regulatory domain-containing protein, partial [Acidobacteriota bacterium]